MIKINRLVLVVFAASLGAGNSAWAHGDGGEHKSLKSEAPAPSASDKGKHAGELYDLRSFDKVQMKTIQRSLIDKGYEVKETGQFDGPTEKALQNFSNKKSFKKSGSLDSRTLKELGVQF